MSSAAPALGPTALSRPGRAAAERSAGGAVSARVRAAAEAAADLAQDWDGLAAEAAEPNVFAERWFVSASLETLGRGRGVRLVEVRRGDRLIGILPIALEKDYGRLTLPFVQNWCHHHLFLGTPLVAKGEERVFWAAILEALDADRAFPNFLHLRGLAEEGPVHAGLVAAARAHGRPLATVHRERRALLVGGTGFAAYYERQVRGKKRKELRRLQARLEEQGKLVLRRLDEEGELGAWCDAYLALERQGWKGEAGSALACRAETDRFFRLALAGAMQAKRLEFLRLDLDGAPIAMLVNFVAPEGQFSFKTCFDERFARFSPGLLLQVENMKRLDDPAFRWMDSCAAEDHPMVDSLWADRRAIVRVTVRLGGLKRGLVYHLCRALETASAGARRLTRGKADD